MDKLLVYTRIVALFGVHYDAAIPFYLFNSNSFRSKVSVFSTNLLKNKWKMKTEFFLNLYLLTKFDVKISKIGDHDCKKNPK